jgi:hypothetical protein
VKLPVFFRVSFLADGLGTAIASALMQRKSMPLRRGAGAPAATLAVLRLAEATAPGRRRDARNVVVQMDATLVDAALDVAGRSA